MQAALRKQRRLLVAGAVVSVALSTLVYGLEAARDARVSELLGKRQLADVQQELATSLSEVRATVSFLQRIDDPYTTFAPFVEAFRSIHSTAVPWVILGELKRPDLDRHIASVRALPGLDAYRPETTGISDETLMVVVAADGAAASMSPGVIVPSGQTKALFDIKSTAASAGTQPTFLAAGEFGAPSFEQLTVAQWYSPPSPGLALSSIAVVRSIPISQLAAAAGLGAGETMRLTVMTSASEPLAAEPGRITTIFEGGGRPVSLSAALPPVVDRVTIWPMVLFIGILMTVAVAVLRSGSSLSKDLKQTSNELAFAHEGRVTADKREKTFFDNAGVGACETDVASGKLLRVNASFSRMLGYPPEELVGLPFVDITHPEDKELSRRTIDSGEGRPRDELQFEKRYIRKDGTPIWAIVNAKLFYDSRGVPISYLTTVMDITSRKRDEQVKADLMRELAHRVRNVMQIVSTISKQTLGTAKTVEQAQSRLSRRLDALTSTHDLLFDQGWVEADVGEIAKRVLRPYSESESAISLPSLALPTQHAQTLALALNELALGAFERAAKKGISPSISLTGHLIEEAPRKKLRLVWKEKLVSNSTRGLASEGFRRRLLMDALPSQFSGRAEEHWNRTHYIYEADLNV